MLGMCYNLKSIKYLLTIISDVKVVLILNFPPFICNPETLRILENSEISFIIMCFLDFQIELKLNEQSLR